MIDDLLTRNRLWSQERTAEKPDYFESLSKLQQPTPLDWMLRQ